MLLFCCYKLNGTRNKTYGYKIPLSCVSFKVKHLPSINTISPADYFIYIYIFVPDFCCVSALVTVNNREAFFIIKYWRLSTIELKCKSYGLLLNYCFENCPVCEWCNPTSSSSPSVNLEYSFKNLLANNLFLYSTIVE